MKQRTWYDVLATSSLAIAGVAAILAVAGAALQQALSVAAAALCAIVFFVPGAYSLAYARRLQARDLALAHVAAFAKARGTLDLKELATELAVSNGDAEKILLTAAREGHLRGRYDGRGRFIVEPEGPGPGERGR